MNKMNKTDRTNEIDHSLIPDNTATIIMKANGKVFAKGIPIDLSDDKALRTTLLHLDALVYILQRTLFYKLAGKPDDKLFDLEAADDEPWIIDRAATVAHVNKAIGVKTDEKNREDRT